MRPRWSASAGRPANWRSFGLNVAAATAVTLVCFCVDFFGETATERRVRDELGRSAEADGAVRTTRATSWPLGGAALDGDLVHDDVMAIVRNPDVVGCGSALDVDEDADATQSTAAGFAGGSLPQLATVHGDSFDGMTANGVSASCSWLSWKMWTNDFWGTPMSSTDSHKSYRPLTVLTFR